MSLNKPQTVNISVPFSARLEVDATYLCYVDHPLIHGSIHRSAPKAKKLLKEMLVKRVEEGLRAANHGNSGRLLGCTDGTVLVVRWAYDGWGYSIGGPGYKYGTSSQGYKTYEEAIAGAKNHAGQSYGGVAWECSL